GSALQSFRLCDPSRLLKQTLLRRRRRDRIPHRLLFLALLPALMAAGAPPVKHIVHRVLRALRTPEARSNRRLRIVLRHHTSTTSDPLAFPSTINTVVFGPPPTCSTQSWYLCFTTSARTSSWLSSSSASQPPSIKRSTLSFGLRSMPIAMLTR